MCGICGYVGPASRALPPEALAPMREALRHRGPDGAGELAIATDDVSGWLGHRRLKVIDLSQAADQPMRSDDGMVAQTYNGEVYNFHELRRELEGRGRRFHSSGDTEVVLRAYEEWGEDFLARLDGMFALAVWDARERKLLLARDRTGKKPLFYTRASGRLVFASEIKSLLLCPGVERRVDLGRLPEFFTYGYVPAPNTLYEGVMQVPPGYVVTYRPGGDPIVRAYWDALPDEQPLTPDEPFLERVAELLRAATERRMVADVPVGALLSGGVDSSVVVGLMAQLASDPVHTFSVGFPEEPSFDEREPARQVSRHFGTRHTEFAVQLDAIGLLDTLLWHHDQPFADSSAIPTYLISRLARQHVAVVLTGDGGDEVLGGYDRFTAAAMASRVPVPLARLGRGAVRLLPRSDGYYGLRRRAERFLEGAHRPVEDRYFSWIAVADRTLLGELLPHRATGDVEAAMETCYRRAEHLPVLDRILYANFKTYLAGDLAVKTDRMSMASSLEARSPFLDTELIEHLARLPARYKVGIARPKPILRRAFYPLLPAKIWARRKHGFGVPLDTWFRGELGELFADEVLAPDARSQGLLDGETVAQLWSEQRAGVRQHGSRLWTILAFERWLRSLERPPAAEPPTSEPVADATERALA